MLVDDDTNARDCRGLESRKIQGTCGRLGLGRSDSVVVVGIWTGEDGHEGSGKKNERKVEETGE